MEIGSSFARINIFRNLILKLNLGRFSSPFISYQSIHRKRSRLARIQDFNAFERDVQPKTLPQVAFAESSRSGVVMIVHHSGIEPDLGDAGSGLGLTILGYVIYAKGRSSAGIVFPFRSQSFLELSQQTSR